jgi:hypothetical protein
LKTEGLDLLAPAPLSSDDSSKPLPHYFTGDEAIRLKKVNDDIVSTRNSVSSTMCFLKARGVLSVPLDA